MSLALPDDGKVIALDKNQETNKIALNFFKKAKQENKIETIIKPALESLKDLKKKKKNLILFLLTQTKKIIKITMMNL